MRLVILVALALLPFADSRGAAAQAAPPDSVRPAVRRLQNAGALIRGVDRDTATYHRALAVLDSVETREGSLWFDLDRLRFVASARIAAHRLLRAWATGECRDAQGAAEMHTRAGQFRVYCDLCHEPDIMLQEFRRYEELREPIKRAVATCH